LSHVGLSKCTSVESGAETSQKYGSTTLVFSGTFNNGLFSAPISKNKPKKYSIAMNIHSRELLPS
jgi:hypothetical protein